MKINKRLKNVPLKKVLLVLLISIILVSQIFTFSQDGEILGVKVRSTKKVIKSSAKTEQSDNASDSIVCKKISTGYVEDLVGVKDLQQGSFYKDVKKDDLTSNSTCIYTTKAEVKDQNKKVVVTVSLQEKPDQQSAKQEIEETKQKEGFVSVADIEDEAYFSEQAKHLVARKDNKVVNVFVNVQNKSSQELQQIATQIANKLLN